MRTAKRALLTLVLVAAMVGSVRWGGALFAHLGDVLNRSDADGSSDPNPPTAELAEATLNRFERFRQGDGDDRLTLSGVELTSVVRFALPGIVPPGIAEPTVALEAGDVLLSARVATAAFPDLPRLDQILGILPDTIRVDLRGRLVPVDQQTLALQVERVHVSRVPLPNRMLSQMLDGLRRDSRLGDDGEALRVPLPDGLERAFVRSDTLVLVALGAGAAAATEEGGTS